MRQSGVRAGLRRSLFWSVCYTIVSATVCSAMILLPVWEKPAYAAPAHQASAASIQLAPVLAQTPPPAPYPPPPPTGAPSGPPPAPPPAYPYAAPSDVGAATAHGTQDAEADSSGAIWFLAGCGLGLIGILLAYVIEPTPPPQRLMGKSPEYVMAYTGAYKAAGKSSQAKQAIIGCVVGTAVVLAVYAVLVFVVLSEASTTSSSGGF